MRSRVALTAAIPPTADLETTVENNPMTATATAQSNACTPQIAISRNILQYTCQQERIA